MVVSVRRIRPDEGPLLKQVRLAALADTPSAFAKTHEEESTYDDVEWTRRATEWSDGSDGATFFVEVDGEVQGLVGGHRPDLLGGVPGTLLALGVARDHVYRAQWRRASAACGICRPSTETSPVVGVSSPQRVRMAVVLPDPLGPRKP